MGSHEEHDGLIYDSESDISQEEVAEKKILKIDRKLFRHKEIDKIEKRRLQNRKSALKCRLRKTHTIKTQEQTITELNQEVGKLRQERLSLFEEVYIK